MSEQHNREPGFLSGVTGIFKRGKQAGGRPAPAESTEQPRPLGTATADLENRLNSLAAKVEERRREQRRRDAIASGQLDPATSKAEQAGIKQVRAEEVHRQIRTDVLAWHTKLGTGIGPQELEALHAFMEEMAALSTVGPGDSLDNRIRGAIARRLFVETGQPAWSELLDRMSSAGEAWPSGEDQTRDAEMAEAGELFLHSGLRSMTDLVIGVVAVWKDHYPAQSTNLWRSVCLRAVAAGIRASLFNRMVEIARQNADDLRAEAATLLADEVEAVQAVLDAGVQSVEQADRVMSGASEVLEQVLPTICLERVQHILDRSKAGAGANRA
jgi:hypothetical protein